VDEDATPVFLGGSPTLQAIYDRGALKCAVVPSPGLTGVRDTGELSGIDIDIDIDIVSFVLAGMFCQIDIGRDASKIVVITHFFRLLR
jgi:hypothetical protein